MQAGRGLRYDVQAPGWIQRASGQRPGQRRPVHQFHHQERRLRRRRLAVVVDPGDVLMRQPAGVLRLRAEPGERLGVAEVQHLDRHEPGQDKVGRAPDFAEPARADPLPQHVPAAEDSAAGCSHIPAATRWYGR